nr:immunoglobulin heavy chain junction region [Mus musculus]MBK4184827.1 immunoglobulin heavy chain junction region [Mus musculus]MBK4185541.1 immunoglobulin heavy chain junction region [Mus musculus]
CARGDGYHYYAMDYW